MPRLLGVDRARGAAPAWAGELMELRRPRPALLADALPGPALRRSAAARRRRAGTCRRSANPVDGRAVLGRRPDRAQERLQEQFLQIQAEVGKTHPLRHARRGRGDQDRRPGSPCCARAATWPSSPRRANCSNGPRGRGSSRSSSASTAACGGSPSSRATGWSCTARSRSSRPAPTPNADAARTPVAPGCCASTPRAGRSAGWRRTGSTSSRSRSATPFHRAHRLAARRARRRRALPRRLGRRRGRGGPRRRRRQPGGCRRGHPRGPPRRAGSGLKVR